MGILVNINGFKNMWPTWFLQPTASKALENFLNADTTRMSISRLQAAYGPLMQAGTEKDIINKRLGRNVSYTGMLSGSAVPSLEYVFPYILANLMPSVLRDLHSINDFIGLYAIHYVAASSLPLAINPSNIRARVVHADKTFLNTFFHKKMAELKKDGIEMTYDRDLRQWKRTGERLPEYAVFPDVRFVLDAVNRETAASATVRLLRTDVSRAVLGIHTAIAACSQDLQAEIRGHVEALLKAEAEMTFVEAVSSYNTAKVEDTQAAFEEQAAISQLLGGRVSTIDIHEKTYFDKFIETEYMGYAGGVSSVGGEGGRRRRTDTVAEPDMADNTNAAMLVGNVALHAVLESKLGAEVDPKTITLLSNTLYHGIHDSKKKGPSNRLENAAIAVRDTDGLGIDMLVRLHTSGFVLPTTGGTKSLLL